MPGFEPPIAMDLLEFDTRSNDLSHHGWLILYKVYYNIIRLTTVIIALVILSRLTQCYMFQCKLFLQAMGPFINYAMQRGEGVCLDVMRV